MLGINGLGRLGRLTVRAALTRGLAIVAINDPGLSAEQGRHCTSVGKIMVKTT